jgi:general secretion pathway protein I
MPFCIHNKQCHAQDGFTLMEVMIAVAILAIALVTALQSQSQSISMANNSRFLTTASLLAQSKMAEMDAADLRDVNSGSGDFGDDFPYYTWQVNVSDSDIDQLKKIELVVKNNTMGLNNSYKLVLYKTEMNF